MEGYTENEETHVCEENVQPLTCDPAEHKELNAEGDACVCIEGYYADGDDCIMAPKCAQIANGDFSGTWDENGIPEKWTKEGVDVTFTNVDGALKVQSNYTSNQKILKSAYMGTSADAEVPAGIKFKIAAPKSSSISVNLFWEDFANNYYTYNWDPISKVFVYAGVDNPRQHDYTKLIDFGDSNFHNTAIVFGPEITEALWRNKDELHIVFRAGKDVDSEIIVDDFEIAYLGGECGDTTSHTVGWAHTQWPESVNENAGKAIDFYGRVYVAGLTDATPNQSEFVFGVKAQFGVKKTSDTDYTWYDAKVNHASNNDFGNNDEYTYKHSFMEAGEYNYTFRFSADNGTTWTNADHAFTATITSNPTVQIDNADFSSWTDGVPTGWVANTNTTFERIELPENSGNYVLAVGRVQQANGNNGYAFDSPEFTTTAETLVPTALKFKLATDKTSKISINLNCGGTRKFYNWSDGAFVNAGNNQYAAVDFGNTTMNTVTIDLTTSVDATFWNGKTCKIEFKYGKNAAYYIMVDNFEFIYE